MHLMDAQLGSRPWDALAGDLAERQHGVVARRQLREMGMERGAIEARIRRGSLRPVHRGVYAVGHRALDLHGRRMAAVLACGPRAFLSHRSACRAWGIARRGFGLIEVSCSHGRHPERPGIVTHRASLSMDERDEVDGVPVTSIFRSVFDLAAIGSAREVERALHEAEVGGLTDRLSLPTLLTRYPGHRGAAAIRTILASREPASITRSELEERFLALIEASGLPRPRLNAALHLRGRFFEVDCLWDAERLIVELDGAAVHGTHRAFHGDRQRDRALLACGYRVSHVTWRQLDEEPEAIVADLRRLLVIDAAPSRRAIAHPYLPGGGG